jgi:hypothetical protein
VPAGNELTQFDYLFNALANKFPGIASASGGASLFQFATSPIAATWETNEDAKAYELASRGSANLTGFYVPGDRLDVAYGDLVLSIEQPSVEANEQYKTLAGEEEDINREFKAKAAEANTAYLQWAAVHTKPDGTPQMKEVEWLTSPTGGISWSRQLEGLSTALAKKRAAMVKIAESLEGPLAAAQKAALEDKVKIGPLSYSQASIGGQLATDMRRWNKAKEGEYEFDVVLEGGRTITYPWRTLYKTEVHQNCWSTSASVHVNTSRIIEDEHYSLRVSAVGLESYPISRGQWYDPNFVNPNERIASGSPFDTDTFFGPEGTLHLVPELLLVMYKPTYRLTVSDTVYKQEFEANADADIDWIDLFGSRFKFDGLASLLPEKQANSTTTITFASPVEASPQIIGVFSKVCWNGHEPKA